MVFPYTFSAKITQFPYKLYFKHHWMYSWFVGTVILVSPVFYLLQKAANSNANIKIWVEKEGRKKTH